MREEFRDFTAYLGLALWFALLKLFKFVDFFAGLTVLWSTIHKSAGQLFAFLVSYVIVLSVFVLFATMVWGYYSDEFSTFESSAVELVRFSFGDGDYDFDALTGSVRYTTYVVWWCYSVIVTLILFNLIIGLISNKYEEVVEEIDTGVHERRELRDFFRTWAPTNMHSAEKGAVSACPGR